MKTRLAFACLVLLLTMGTQAETPLRVVVSEVPPCVFLGEKPYGFSIELWSAIADELDRPYELTVTSFSEKLEALKSQQADVAIGCITVTEERETRMDFSHPITSSGFSTASLIKSDLIPNFSDESLKMLLVLLLFVVFFAHLMWWSEHGQESISDHYLPGVFESIWFSVVTMSTVGYGDISPKNWLGRVSAILLILTGVTAFGVIFGQFAADAIGERAENPVHSVDDLRGYVVGTKNNTATASYLDSMGIETITFDKLETGAEALREGSIDVLMHDTFAISHLVDRNQDLMNTGPEFAPHYVAIATQEKSALREPINSALLRIQGDGRFQQIKDRWF